MSPFTPRSTRRRTAGITGATIAVLALSFGLSACASSADATPAPSTTAAVSSTPKPTIVLVHGAWADPSSFSLVTASLQKDGYKVLNAPNPLQGLASDAANVAAFVNQNTTGPVVLVGHSYGGSVITNAGLATPTVKSLVYIDAFAPAEGESALDLTGALPGSSLAVADPSTVFNFVDYPGAATGDLDAYIKPELFNKFFAPALSAKTASVLGASQNPIALSALAAPSAAPAWKTLKSYFFIGENDKIIPPAEQAVMAKRANGTVVKGKADHLSMLETPKPIVKLIEQAATAK